MSAARPTTWRRGAAGVAAALGAGLGLVAGPALADHAEPSAQIDSLSRPVPGKPFTVRGHGCAPGEEVFFGTWSPAGSAFGSDMGPFTATTDDAGSFELTFTLADDYVGGKQLGAWASCASHGVDVYPHQSLKFARVPYRTTTMVRLEPRKVRVNARGTVVVTVAAEEGIPVGKVQVGVRGRKVTKPLTVAHAGTRTVKLPRLGPGKHKVKVRYLDLGVGDHLASRAEVVKLKVKRR